MKVSDGTYWYMNGSGRHDKQAGIDIIMRTARSLLGVPYVWLGVYPQDGGMDCASFTWYLYKQLGIDIGFETYDQMYSGVRVFGDPQPGDIILMYYGAWPNYNPMLPEHVVLYAGGGMIYEEPTFGGRCQYVSLASKGPSTCFQAAFLMRFTRWVGFAVPAPRRRRGQLNELFRSKRIYR